MIDLTSHLRRHGVDFKQGGEHRHVRPGWVGIDCPWCGGSGVGKYHLGLNLSQMRAGCWRCGGKSIHNVLMEVLRLRYNQVVELLGDVTPQQQSESRVVGKLQLPKGLQELGAPHRKYLKGRGFDPDEIVRLWGVKATGPVGRMSRRLFIPIYQGTQVVSWTTRAISPKQQPRYVTASPEQESVPSKHVLYGAQRARHAIVVTEGPTDVWRLGPGGVATLGMLVSSHQIEAMAQFPVRGICFDNEPPAQRRAERLADLLEVFPGKTYIIKVDADDLGSASRREVSQIRKHVLGET